MRLRAVAALCLALAAAPGGATAPAVAADAPPAAAPRGPRFTYDVSVAPDVRSLRVRWCVAGFAPRRAWLVDVLPLDAVTLRSAEGGTLVRDPSDPPILLASVAGEDACFEYEVDLGKVEAQRAARRVGRATLVRLGGFLLRAGLLPPDLEATVRFDLPAGVDVAAPWPEVAPRTFRVDPSTWEFQGWVALGAFARRVRELAGCTTEILSFDGALACSPDGVDRWLGAAMGADALLFGGRYPRRRLLVGIEPVRPSSDPVPFGSAWSGGGPHAFLQVAANCADADFHDDWTATHELLHAALPHVKIEDAWCGEGFVTYYQEVLRARAGMQTPAEAWAALHDGFRRGRRAESPRSIADDSAHMHERHLYWRVYWAGAALALRLDVEARRASGGATSLDDALRALPAHPAADRRSLSGREVVAELARRVPSAPVEALTTAILTSSGFPDLAAAYRDLGLVEDGDRLRFDPRAPLAAVRDAIMAPRPAPPAAR